MNKAGAVLILAEAVALVLGVMLAWVLSVLGYEVCNPFSEDSVRWLFSSWSTMVADYGQACVVFILTAVACITESGMIPSLIRKDRTAMYAAAFVLLGAALLLFPLAMTHNPLLGITGRLFPSPWLTGVPFVASCWLIVSSLLFAIAKGKVKGLLSVPEFLSLGFSRFGVWIVAYMLGDFVYNILRHCFE